MRRLILHIGDHKTGTSALQRWCARESDAAGARGFALGAGRLYYPRAGRRLGPGHHNLAWKAAGAPRHRPDAGDWDAVAAEIAALSPETGAVLVSSEAFEFAPPKAALAAARTALAGLVDRIDVLVYVRPHASRLVSSYVERLKAGVAPSRESAFVEAALGAKMFAYHDRLMRWRRAAGAGRFFARPYLPAKRRSRSISPAPSLTPRSHRRTIRRPTPRLRLR